METFKKLVGERIAQARESAGLSQDALAEMLEVDQSRISRWETGKNLPTGKRRKKLLEALRATKGAIFAIPEKDESAMATGLELLGKFADAPRDLQTLVVAFVDERPALLRDVSPEFLEQLSRLLSARKK